MQSFQQAAGTPEHCYAIARPMHVMGEGAFGTVHCVTSLAPLRTSSCMKSAGLASCNLDHWRWNQCESLSLSSPSVSSCVAHAVGGGGHTTSKSLRQHVIVGGQQRWQQGRVYVRNPQVSTSRSGPLGVDELQTQLESLQQEAERVQYRASSARARFMRLSEAAEQLRLRAALDVKAGRDDSAVRLLKEKQKVMQALEVSKKRAGVLEELHAKLNEAISLKETQMIAALSCARLDMSDMDMGISDAVRFVAPPGDTTQSKVAVTQAMVGLEQFPAPVEELEVSTEEASNFNNAGTLNGLMSRPTERNHEEADSAVEGLFADGRTLESMQRATETGALPDTEATTDERGYPLAVESGILSAGDDIDGGGEHEGESSSTLMVDDRGKVEEDTMGDLLVSRGKGEDPPPLSEEDQQRVAASMVGGDVGSQANVHHTMNSALKIPNGYREIRIAEVEAELDEIKHGLKSILDFIDAEYESGGALQLQLSTLLKRRAFTQDMIMDLAKSLDTR